MKVILTREVDNLGQVGEVKNVAPGYARNYLIPKGLAVKATAGAIREFENLQAAQAHREERLVAHADALAQQLSQVTLTFEAKASEKGRLFGSITTAEIAQALEQQVGEKFDRRKHILSEPLRQVGRHQIPIRLTADVTAEVQVVVKPEGGELAEVLEDLAPAEAETGTEAETQLEADVAEEPTTSETPLLIEEQ
mgnify:CR=1 FL=1